MKVSGDANGEAKEVPRKRSARWDQTGEEQGATATTPVAAPTAQKKKISTWEAETPAVARWEETPSRSKGSETPAGGAMTPGSNRLWDATPGLDDSRKRNRWDETPKTERGGK